MNREPIESQSGKWLAGQIEAENGAGNQNLNGTKRR